ncbi:filamentous hemagglutinin [Rhizobium sp. AC27/96]|uniref:YDG domain-containing protein n=1 Tax=Rhizobium sp. AC27/96 TaxID=1841653 RepID=UPI00082749A5|nr:YDG domain-containing protein [Rhizobium sp. AC27/96]OCJ00564.1 filamentous hemagglutinin [Rhizobium sp. AC27/96]
MTKQMTRMTLSHKTRLVALLASTALVHSTVALAQSLPTGGQVAAGSASIGTPSAGALTVTQTSGSAVVNWQSFNVGKGNRVTFVQPDANAAILNRVTGQTSSTIAGQINANGQVYLINPNGIAITNSGTVKTGAFVASTLGISDDDFMSGKRTFTGNGASAPVTNAGTITINRGGYMALIGGSVANSGVITVPMGKAALGSGEQATLDLSGDGFLQVAVPTKAGGNQALVSNSGRISARGGTVQLTAAAAKDMARQAVNMSGTIEAKGVSGRSGDIVLSGGDGEVAVSGRIDAGNAKGAGGKVQVTGRKITLAGAKINASGKTGGGTVNIGGERQGKGALQRAETLTVDANTVINADAITAGNGGNIVLWSDDLTRFAGTITAKGGTLSGNGGEVEVSGKAKLSYTGLTDLTAAQGAFGNLLLDPYNVTISTGTGSNTDGGFNATGNDSIINVNTLTNALATANVRVTTGSSSDANNPQAGTITIAAPIAWNAPTTLTLAAASDININAAISAHNSGLIVSSGGTITTMAAVDIGAFILASGSWVQNGAVLPAFSAQDFRITDGTSFLRVTGGDGTSATPYTVADVYGLQGIGSSSDYLSAKWKLAGDIDASGTAIWNNGAGFDPIGDGNITFTGSLDGASHTITGLTINRPNTNTVGLFGIIGQGGGVSGLGLVNASVSGRSMTGGLAGSNAGGIVQSYISGSVSGATHTGGLVGYNTGAINLSYSTASVSGGMNVGGLLGMNFGTMNQVYASGAVSGMGNLGGLVGGNSGTVVASYFDMSTTLQSSGVGNGFTSGISGLNSTQARSASNYSDWDFNAYWYQSGDLRPILRSEAAAADANGVVTISNLHQLALMGANLAGNYKLAVDIDAGAAVGTNAADIWSTGGWVPVGTYGTAFTGVFDGAGHTITGLVISRAASFLGLFGNSAGTIQNIGLIGESVYGYSYTGGLVGNNTGTISNAYATGTVNGMQYVGGLTGWNSGSVSNSYATTSTFGNYDVGGLVGHNHGSISNSYATGAIYGSNTYAGGLAGFNDSTIKFAYATGAVSGNTYVGGLVGYNDSGSTIDNAYASGAVNGSVAVGGLVGRNFYSTITNSFWDVSTTGRSSGYGQSFSGTFSAIGLTTGQARSASSYSGWDFGGVWYQAGDMRPILRSEAATADSNGVASIWNLHQLALIGANLTGNYTLANDIDASETSGANASGIWSTGGWVPLGNINTMFRGSFDGNNHTINALTVTGYDQVGLFSVSAGSISNLGLVGGSVAGVRTDVGALAGWNYGTISNSYSTATVSGLFDVGGLVGMNIGTISSSYTTGSVSGSNAFVGGLVGYNSGAIINAYATGAVSGGAIGMGGLVGSNSDRGGTINNSYATGSVSGGSRAGGLAGDNGGTITNAYASGAVSGTDTVGGLVGGNYAAATISNSYAIGAVNGAGGGLIGQNDGTVTASFWDMAMTGQASGINTGSSAGMTGLTTAQMQNPFSFINAGWDFAGVWGKSTSGANDGYMMLRALSTGLYDDYVSIGNGTRTYGDSNTRITGATLTGVCTGNVSLTWGNAIASTTNAGTYNYSDPNIVSVTETGPRTAYVDYSGTLTISQRVLSFTGGRTYDGSTDVTAGNLTLGNLANGETLTLAGAGSMADKNVGTGKALSLGTLLLGDDTGLASNYILGSGTVDIAKATIASITGITADDKTYDGTADATLVTSGAGFTGMAAGDALTVATAIGVFSDKNAGTGKTVGITGLSLGGADAGNYTLISDTATTTADIAKASIASITGITADNKTYDGTTAATLVTSGAGFTGMVAGDALTVATSIGTFSDKNAGTGKTVGITGLSLGGTDAGNYTLASDTATTTADIAKASISSITGITAANKTYNGTVNATLNTSGAGFTGMIANDVLTVGSATGAFSDKNVGIGKTVGITGLSLGGVDAGNYTLASNTATTTADIAKAYVFFTGITASSKVYDGTTTATVNISTIPAVNTDDMHVAYTSANFSDKNAGISKTVAVDGLYITGADAGNYQLAITSHNTFATITPAIISSIDGITANGKTYDGSTTATLNTSGAIFNGVIANDNLTVATALGAFSDQNVGTGKTVTISGLTLGGIDALNYRLDTTTAVALADIGQRVISLSGSRTYNGSSDLDASIFTLSNLVDGETLTLSGTGSMADKNAGLGKGVTLGSLALGDDTGLASNYTLSGGTDIADIARAVIAVGGITAGNKTYDGTTGATLDTSGVILNGKVTGDNLSLGSGFAGAFADANAGTGKTVMVSGLSLDGSDAANYTLSSNPVTTTADIGQRVINLSGSRTYDGSADLAASIFTLSNLVSGETLTLSGTGSMADKNAGLGKGVALGSLSLGNGTGGGLAANYTFTGGTDTVDIAKAVISSIGGITAGNKTYDGATTVALDASGVVFNGMVAGDTLALYAGFSGAFSDQNAGSGKTVNISGLSLLGADAGNYTLASNVATATADIGQRVISLSGSRTYNGSSNLAASIFQLSNLVTGETLSLSGIGRMADKNVGTAKNVNLGTLTLGNGTGGGLASNYTLSGGTYTADITRAVISSVTGITASGKTYDGSAIATLNTSGAIFNGMVSGDSLTAGGSTGAFADANAGSGKTVNITGLSLGGADAGNYSLASSTAATTADIGQRVISLSGSRTYDGSSDVDASIFTLSNLVGNETLTLTGTGSMADKNAGSSKGVALASLLLGDSIHGDGGLASNYTLAGGLDTVNIARAAISSIGGITAGNKTYDGSANATLNTNGAIFNGKVTGDTLTLGGAPIGIFADANAGTGKVVSISGLSLSGADAGNYTLANATATTLADIGQRIISLSGSRTYDGSADLDASIFTLSNLVVGQTLTLSGTGAMTDKNAGSGKAVALGSLGLGNGSGGGLASNYTLIGGTDTASIARAVISSVSGITAGNKTYDGTTGATLDASNAAFNGKVLGDNLTLGSGAIGAFADANAGNGKVVSISGLSLDGTDAANYTLADATATTFADIARRAITVAANGDSRAYGDANPALSYVIGGAGLVSGDSLSGSLATSATTASNVGTYAITQGTLDNSNYAISYTGAGLTVVPRAIAVSANAASRAYGDANPLLSYTIGGAGLVNNDTLSGDLVTSATGTSNVGAYAITQGTLAASGNYALTFTGADLTVSRRAITVAAGNATRIYGDANPAFSYTVGGAGLVNNDSLSGTLATSATANSGVGSYGIGQGSLAASGNYDLTFLGGTLAVTPRAITVVANGAIRTYGDANPVFTYVAGGLINGDSFSGSLASPATATSGVGTYAIELGSLGNANYTISYTAAGLTITPRLISVIASNASRVTGAANPTFAYTIGGAGLVNGDRLTGALFSAADRRSAPGSYAIGQGTLAGSANYDVSFVGGLLTVTAAPSSPTTDLASAIVPRSYAPGTDPLPPVPGGEKDTFSFADDGTRDFLTDPRFAGSVVCFGDGMSCIVQPPTP